jgi:hypothetical protein
VIVVVMTVVIVVMTVVIMSTPVVAAIAEFLEFASKSPDLAPGLAAGPIRSTV